MTTPALLEAQAAHRAASAYETYDPGTGGFASISWAEMVDRVAARAAALAGEGLTAGDRIALWLPNGIEWVAFD